MKLFIVIITAVLTLGCENGIFNRIDEKERLPNALMAKVAHKLKKEKGLIPFGTGGRAMDQIKMLALMFQYRKPVDIGEGRELLVAAVEMFVAEINQNERIRPYLNNYPFEPKNIEIQVFLKNQNGSSLALGKLCVISANEGILKYEIHDLNNGQLKTIYQETYEEALEKIHQSHQKSA